jgi:hypothetical protein
MPTYVKILIGAVLGSAAGFAYYYFIGCSSGSCPITSRWYTSTLYGLVAGIIIGFPGRKKKEEKNIFVEEEKNNN